MPDLGALFAQNKTAVYGVGGAAVVGFALYKRSKGAATSGDTSLSAGAQTAAASGGAAYDSTASDLYGALQPQLEAIGRGIDQLQNPGTIPTPAPPPHGTGLLPPTPHGDMTKAHQTIPVYHPAPPRPAPNPTPFKTPSPVTYRVRAGDSLSKIAASYPSKSITSKTIYAANKQTIGANPNLIKPGQTLVIR